MRFSIFASAILPVVVDAFGFNTYDLGFQGVYPIQSYVSTDFQSPTVKVDEWDQRCDNGDYVMVAPRGDYVKQPGPFILDPKGNLVWTETKWGSTTNFRVQNYKGEDYLTFWSGKSEVGGEHSYGIYYMLNSTYDLVYEVHAVNQRGDQHEFKITKDDTVLVTVYQNIELDCTSLGLPGKCWINDSLFQELEIDTGKLLFEWRASDHVPFADSYKDRHGDGHIEMKSWDWFHMNSVDKDDDGNYIISSRYTHSILCISPAGDVLWTLGGKHSNFTDLSDGRASDFAWQHHATWHTNNTLSIFDNNGNNVFHSRSEYSRGLVVTLDFAAMTAAVVHEYVHPDAVLAISQGSTQIIPDNGNVFVGWGNTPSWTEFSASGEVLCSAHFSGTVWFEILDAGLVKSYRTFKNRWVGRPRSPPDIKIHDRLAYVSWNGATEVATWRLQSAEDESAAVGDCVNVEERVKSGFEEAFELPGDRAPDTYFRVIALDGKGEVLGYSALVRDEESHVSFLQLCVFAAAFVIAAVLAHRYWGFLRRSWDSGLRRVRRRGFLPGRQKVQLYDLIENREREEALLGSRDRDSD